jgi:hypothetical protein
MEGVTMRIVIEFGAISDKKLRKIVDTILRAIGREA